MTAPILILFLIGGHSARISGQTSIPALHLHLRTCIPTWAPCHSTRPAVCLVSPPLLTHMHTTSKLQQVATPAFKRGGGGRRMPLPASGGWRDIETKVRQQKSEDRDATLNLLLKHPDATLATYVWRQIKHMKYAFETLAATPDLLLKHLDETLATYVRNSWNTRNMHMKHLQKTHENTSYGWKICNIQIKTLATYVSKQIKQFEQTLATCATSLDLLL
jgi:hypothetical protein